MKKILTNSIVAPIKQPFTRYSLEHLQQSYTDLFNSIINCQGIAGNVSEMGDTIHALWGCDNTNNGTDWIIYFGAMYNDGEIYEFDGASITCTSGLVPCIYKETTYITSDPLELSDHSTVNVHQINKVVILPGTAGSGAGQAGATLTYLYDYSELAYPYDYKWRNIGDTNQPAFSDFPGQPSTSNFGYNMTPARFRKDSEGFVHLEGCVKGFTSTQVIFTMPLGYRPEYIVQSLVTTNEQTALVYNVGILNVAQNGIVQIIPNVTSIATFNYFSLVYKAV